MNPINIPWIEKYRPNTLNDVISHTHIITALKQFVKKGNLPHLILFGPPGTGKTSAITACAKEMYGEDIILMCIEINASEERGVDVVRSRIMQFVSCQNAKLAQKNTLKLVILDEADSMTEDAQIMLRTVMEKFSYTTRFCLICNYLKKIHFSILSRCKQFRFAPLDTHHIKERLKYVCEQEHIDITDEGANEIINKSEGDMRKVLNILQAVSSTNSQITAENVNTCLCHVTNDEIDDIIDSLVHNDVQTSFGIINNYIRGDGYSLSEILHDISQKILNVFRNLDPINPTLKKLSTTKLSQLIENMGKVEYGLLSNVSTTVLILLLIGSFQSII